MLCYSSCKQISVNSIIWYENIYWNHKLHLECGSYLKTFSAGISDKFKIFVAVDKTWNKKDERSRHFFIAKIKNVRWTWYGDVILNFLFPQEQNDSDFLNN